MHIEDVLDFSNLSIENQPFRFFSLENIIRKGLALELLGWFESSDAWGYTETDFYTQYEFSLFDAELPENLKSLISESTIALICKEFSKVYNINTLQIVGITAHKLIDGYKIGVHNDYLEEEEETHRLIIQINSNWKEENGGYLMLFKSSNVKDVDKIIIPANNTAIGFNISNKSYHAVSKVYNFSRYTLVYTFKETK